MPVPIPNSTFKTACLRPGQDDMLSNPRGEFVSTDAAIPDDFLIPGTDQPLALWVQNRQNVRLGLANRP
jgi:hypothetical protein